VFRACLALLCALAAPAAFGATCAIAATPDPVIVVVGAGQSATGEVARSLQIQCEAGTVWTLTNNTLGATDTDGYTTVYAEPAALKIGVFSTDGTPVLTEDNGLSGTASGGWDTVEYRVRYKPDTTSTDPDFLPTAYTYTLTEQLLFFFDGGYTSAMQDVSVDVEPTCAILIPPSPVVATVSDVASAAGSAPSSFTYRCNLGLSVTITNETTTRADGHVTVVQGQGSMDVWIGNAGTTGLSNTTAGGYTDASGGLGDEQTYTYEVQWAPTPIDGSSAYLPPPGTYAVDIAIQLNF
jgi:hypothetical protein